MAERRMFAKAITESDAFLEMPSSSQSLYFHLSMNADDDGFVGSPKRIIRMINCSEDDLKILIGKRFVLWFESGVVAIKHWKMNNLIRKDRYQKTVYQEELKTLETKENGSYTELECCGLPMVNQVTTNEQPNDNQLATQYSIGKDSIGKYSIVKVSEERKKERIEEPDLAETEIQNSSEEDIQEKHEEDVPEEPVKRKATKRKSVNKSFDEIIDAYTDNEELRTELKAHLQTRKQAKAALTNRAIELELMTLDRLTDSEATKVRIVQRSIERGWTGFFPLPRDETVSQEDRDEKDLEMYRKIEEEMREENNDFW